MNIQTIIVNAKMKKKTLKNLMENMAIKHCFDTGNQSMEKQTKRFNIK